MSGVNKVIFGTETLIDLTDDTVTPEVLFKGDTAHKANGDKIIGTYEAPSPGTMIEKTVTADGTYNASDDNVVGYSKVIVQKPFNTGEKTITEDGTYNASDDGYVGYTKVIVNVPGGGGGYVTTIDGVVQERNLDFFSDMIDVVLPYNFNKGSIVVLEDNIHLLGGYENDTKRNHYKWDGSTWSEVSELPYDFYEGCAVVYNNEIHILGGYENGTKRNHYKWDGSTWSEVSELPYDFYEGCAVVYVYINSLYTPPKKETIHILGSGASGNQTKHYAWDGTDWIEYSTLPYNFFSGSAVLYDDSNVIHILGGGTNQNRNKHYVLSVVTTPHEWTPSTNIPYDFYEGSAVVFNNEIHILENNVDKRHYKWNGIFWDDDSPLPSSSDYNSAIVYDNKINLLYHNDYYIGSGSSWTEVSILPEEFYTLLEGGQALILNNEIHTLGRGMRHYKWDGSEWSEDYNLIYYFKGTSAVIYNNEIHMLGGDYSDGYERFHYKWNGSTWISVSTLPYDFHNGKAVVYNNEIHILGGFGGTSSTQHYKWDGSTWTPVSTLPLGFFWDFSAVVLNNEIHILGGGSQVDGYTNHYKWDGSIWTSVSTLPYDFSKSSAVVYNNEIYILGFLDKAAYKYNGTSWEFVSTLPYDFRSGSAVVYNNEIHILGGYANYAHDETKQNNRCHYKFSQPVSSITWERQQEKIYTLLQDDEE